MKTLWTILVALVAVMPCSGTSIIFPTYSTPVVVDGSLIVLSADRLELICVSKAGKELWRQKLSSKGSLIAHRSGKILLTQGASVRSLDTKHGSFEPLFSADPKVEWVRYSAETNLFWGPVDGEQPALALFDGATHVPLATEKLGETLAYADQDLVVLAKGHRKASEGGGYSFSKGWLEAFNRQTMRKVWSVEFEKQPWPHHYVVRCGNHIISDDASDLLVIDIATGEVRRDPAVKPEDAIGPSGLRDDNGSLTYLTSELNYKDFNQSKQTLYKLSVPGLKVIETRAVKVIEAASSEKVGDLLITDALYRTACFRPDGTKLWEHFQLHRTPVVDGVIYFSDYNKGVARMGALDVATGKQQFFLSERVKIE
jgi:outer membrane protein assembly factor BamB